MLWLLLSNEFQCTRIYAVAQSSWRRTIVEDMAQMGITPLAYNFSSRHTIAIIYSRFNALV